MRPNSGSPPTALALERAKRALVWDGAWANVVAVMTGGVLLVGFALALGAGPFAIGVLAAVPFLAQLAQIPAILLVERIRRRRRIVLVTVTIARIVVLALAIVPFLSDHRLGLACLLAGDVVIAALGAVAACAWNSWMHDLLPKEQLGGIFARRLFWATTFALVAGLAGGYVVDHWSAPKITAYAVLFAVAAGAGFISCYWLSRIPEPAMRPNLRRIGLLAALRAPTRDPGFRPLLLFTAAWNFASNLTAPFFAVYFVQQLGLELGTVVGLWALSQLANMLTLQLWGRLADRLSNRAILAVGAPVYLGAVLALPFAALPAPHALTLPVLGVIHIVMGAATAAIGLATGNIGLKLAPHGRATEYLASMSLVGSFAAGLAPVLGGALASLFALQEFSIVVHWGAAAGSADLTALRFRHWEFLFALTFVIGLYAVHFLSRVREGEQVAEREVIRHFVLEAQHSMRSLSSVSGLRVATVFPFVFSRATAERPSERSPHRSR